MRISIQGASLNCTMSLGNRKTSQDKFLVCTMDERGFGDGGKGGGRQHNNKDHDMDPKKKEEVTGP